MLTRRIFVSAARSTFHQNSAHRAFRATFRNFSMAPLQKPQKIALIQLATGPDKHANLRRAAEFANDAAAKGASIIVLPECFNSPYGTEHFPSFAEPIPEPNATTYDETKSPSFAAMSKLAKGLGVHLIAGSIPESTSDGKLYNTSMIFNPSGELITTHRKVHLFDIDIPGKIKFKESEVLTAGNNPTVFDIPGVGRVGVGICYDVRFPELAIMAARGDGETEDQGAFLMVYPGAFNMTTGPLHWELLARARAVDNQIYVAMCSPARDLGGTGYVAWGESMVVGPGGEVVEKAGAGEETVFVELKPERLEEIRKGIPVGTQRRFDVYADISKVKP